MAIGEGIAGDAGDAAGEADGGQVSAEGEGIVPQAGDAAGDGDRGQGRATRVCGTH